VFTIALIGLTMLLFDKARAPGAVWRRALTPVTAVFTATVAWFVISLYVLPAYPETASVVTIVNGLLGLAIPMAILLGLGWENLYVARSVGQIAVRAGEKPLTAAGVQTMIGEALEDSTTALALWAPERAGYVDVDGAPLELPRDPRVRSVTHITNGDGPVAALIHHPRLDTDSHAIDGLAATSLMLVENIRLLDELRASRLRIVEAGDHQRRRLERDLHDGAQQRLMAVMIRLRMLEEGTEDERIASQLEAIGNDAEAAVEELRSLAHGIYPPVLRSYGLADALRSLASTAPIPISVTDEGIGRCSPPVETTAYFCSAEAIQNAIKHAGSNVRVDVTVGRDRDRVHFAITDDGVGIDHSERVAGDGLTGMRDRVGAVGGELEIVSSPGRGTTVRGTIPEAVTPRADDALPPRNPEASTPPRTPPRSATGG
jgi:signal transduction histidine kinase